MQDQNTYCKSVFKYGTEGLTTERLTEVWITLINQIERSKAVIAGAGL